MMWEPVLILLGMVLAFVLGALSQKAVTMEKLLAHFRQQFSDTGRDLKKGEMLFLGFTFSKCGDDDDEGGDEPVPDLRLTKFGRN